MTADIIDLLAGITPGSALAETRALRPQARANAQRSMVLTDVTFSDLEIVNAAGRSKQKAASTVTLTFPGGTADGLTVRLCDSMTFDPAPHAGSVRRSAGCSPLRARGW